tara:strand:+ start:83 stop:532 length:450 start_codon:yes stop_codon:yes gene_type:complete
MSILKPKRSGTSSSVPTTSNLVDGEFAINTADQKIYMRSGGNIVEVGNAQGGTAFKTITVSGQTDIVADSATDTLTLAESGLVSITTTAGTDTVTIGTPSSAQIPFTKSNGSASNIDLSTSGTIGEILANLYLPFVKSNGTSVTTLLVT